MMSTLMSSTRRVALRGCQQALRLNRKNFSSVSPAMAKLSKGLGSELQFEKENYEQPEEIAKLPKEWTLNETPGDVNLSLSKKVGEKTVTLEWQLVTPFDADLDGYDAEGKEEYGDAGMDNLQEATDFSITISQGEEGMLMYCSTQQGEGHRFVIGSVKSYTTEEEKNSISSYNGPEFDDLEEKLQEAVDEYLGELGINDALCDFIDASSVDKEHREYVRWLENVNTFMSK